MTVTYKIESRKNWFEQEFHYSSDVVFHPFTIMDMLDCMVIYFDGMVNKQELHRQLLLPLIQNEKKHQSINELLDSIITKKQISISNYVMIKNLHQATGKLLEGHALLLINDEETMFSFPLTDFKMREIAEPSSEEVIRGPKEAFVENIQTNITLLRRRIKSEKLTVEKINFGSISNTETALIYIHGICSEELVIEIKERLSRIEHDAVLATSYLESYLEDNPYSPFPQLQNTERPDVATGALLEGRVVLMVDGSPSPIIAPTTFFMFLQAAEDYYQRFIFSTLIRWLRIFFLFVSLLLPSFYVAVLNFHPEMLPTNLIITVAASRDIIPFPALVEALIMEVTFEVLREAGIRIPKPIGQTLSILGALVIGTAAVEAGIVSAPMVIIVSLTGISSFVIPHIDLAFSIRLLRFVLLFLAGMLGLFGLMVGLILLSFHLVSLRSFGAPYLAPLAPLSFSDWKDTIVRAPHWAVQTRAKFLGAKHIKRSDSQLRPKKPKGGHSSS